MEPPTLELLFRWLHSSNEAESNRAFSAYHRAVSGPLLRALAFRHLGGNPSLREDPGPLAEDLLQELFMEWFHWIKQERPAARTRIGELTPQVRLPAHGEFFDRRCQHWAGDIQAWVNEAMAFGQTLPPDAEACATAHNGRLKPLKAEAEKLPSEWYGKVSPPPWQCDEASAGDMEDDEEEATPALQALLRALAKWAKDQGEDAADAELGTAGAAALAVAVEQIHRDSAKVRIPLPALLHWMAGKRVIDHFRKRRMLEIPLESDAEDTEEDARPAPIDTEADPKGEDGLKRLEFAQAADAHLFADLEQAWQAGASAHKIQQLERRCAVRRTIFNLLLAGHTQDEIAAATDLTRDQVRTHLKKITALLMPLKEIW